MKVLVCGSRDFYGTSIVMGRLSELPAGSEIIHGAARGADQMAEAFAQNLGLATKAFPADWQAFGNRAGIIRNLEMLDQKPDLVIAFWDGESKGTQHTIHEAGRRGIPVEVIVNRRP